jgi:hypothetical protein
MKKLLIIAVFPWLAIAAWSQGCVAIRNIAGISPDLLFKNLQPKDKLLLSITNRYFEAPRTYKGDQFVTDTLVRNKLYTLNISLLKIIPNGWSLSLTVPISANSRRNYADHGGPKALKHTTHSFGLGDMRFTAYKWLFDPLANRKGNVQFGLGIKFPTGDYRYEDYFFRNDSVKVLAPVDQAIQLGDGGTGITAELSAFYSIYKTFNLFFQGFYLASPREQNGVSNLKGRSPTGLEVTNNTTVMSVPDQFSVRAGASFQISQFDFSANLRYEEVPVNDLIGGNKGFRRAASITSIETGMVHSLKGALVFFNMGFPFRCNIVQNTQNNMTPAGFANFVASFGATFKL